MYARLADKAATRHCWRLAQRTPRKVSMSALSRHGYATIRAGFPVNLSVATEQAAFHPMLRMLGKASSINVRKVLWTCAELGLAFEQDWGAGFRATNVPEFVALNPNAMVPAIRVGEFVLWESNSIIRYLAGRYDGESFYPGDPCERAKCDQWIDWQASELNRAWSYAFLALVRHSPAHQDRQQIDLSCARLGEAYCNCRQATGEDRCLHRWVIVLAGGHSDRTFDQPLARNAIATRRFSRVDGLHGASCLAPGLSGLLPQRHAVSSAFTLGLIGDLAQLATTA